MASSTFTGTPSPPPPTPSAHQGDGSSTSSTADALSHLLHQLLITPNLAAPPPRRRFSPPPPPSLRLHSPEFPQSLLSAASSFGFFHLSDHLLSPHRALPDSLSLLQNNPSSNLSSLGFDHDLELDDGDRVLALESEGNSESDGWGSLCNLKEFGEGCKGLALELLEMLSGVEAGISRNPVSNGDYKPRCLVWVSKDCRIAGSDDGDMRNSKCYPYIVGIHCQFEMNERKMPCWIIGDGGESICVQPCPGSLLVTIGDIAQVWSNGRFKKVNGRPQPSVSPVDYHHGESDSFTLSVLLTLPLDSIISPALHLAESCPEPHAESGHGGEDDANDSDKRKYRPFSLEEYAWRVYHERLPLKDPILRFKL